MTTNHNEPMPGEAPLVDDYLEGMEVTRVVPHLEANMGVDDAYFDLLQEANGLRRRLDSIREQQLPISEEDVELVLQKYDAAIAVSNETNAHSLRAAFVAQYGPTISGQ